MSKQKDTLSGRTYGGLSQEQRKAVRHQQFLEAGLEVFGTVGFRKATVRGLCRQAKLTDRYFYEAFGSLELLLMAVYENRMTEIRERIIAAVAAALPSGDMSTVVHAGLDCFFSELEDSRVAQVCMVELEGVSSDVNQLYHGYISDFADILVTMTRQVYPKIELPEDEWLVLGISMVGAMRQAATHWLLSDYRIERKTLVEATAKLFIGLVKQVGVEPVPNI